MALRTPPSWMQNGSHPAENDRLTTQGIFRSSGVLSFSDLQVTQSSVPAMSVQIAAGWGVILGTYQSLMGAYQFTNDAAATATIAAADPTNPRIDLICITVSDAYYTGATNQVAINVVTGTPAGSPSAPATPTNSIVLARVAVAALATTIVNANITDYRVMATTAIGTVGVTTVTTTSYTPVLSDAAAIVTLNNASAISVTIPTNASVAYTIGTQITFAWITGAGQPTISAVTPGTTTIISTGATSASPKLRVANSVATAIKIATDIWLVTGDIA